MARPRSETARQRLLAAAVEILVVDGVASCTADEVARRSGVAKTTLYRHFGAIEALVFAVVEANVSATEAPNTGSLRGDLAEIHRRYLDMAGPQPARELFVWMVSKAIDDPTYREMFKKARVQPRGPTVIALQRAIARGEIDPGIDIEAAMHIIQGPLISQRIVDNSAVTDRELETMLDMITRALTAGP